MASKKEITYTKNTYELVLSHLDIVRMMNDTDVGLAGGTVEEDQVMEVLVRDCSNSDRRILEEFTECDNVVFRFRVITETTDSEDLGDIDVEPVT